MDADVLKQIKEQLEVDFKDRMTASELQKKGLEVDLNKKRELKSGLIRRLALEVNTSYVEDIKEEILRVKDEIDESSAKIKDLNETEEINTNEIVNALTLVSDLHEQFDKLKPSDQRKLVMTAFRRILLRKGRLGSIVFGNRDKKTGAIKNGATCMFFTEPFELLSEKWHKEEWKRVGPKYSPDGYEEPSKELKERIRLEGEKISGQSVNKIEMREPDGVGAENCCEHGACNLAVKMLSEGYGT